MECVLPPSVSVSGADLRMTRRGFIALHIVERRAQHLNDERGERCHRFVDGLRVQVVECFYNFHFDRDTLDFSRLCAFALFCNSAYFKENRSRKTIPMGHEVFRALIARNCSEHSQMRLLH